MPIQAVTPKPRPRERHDYSQIARRKTLRSLGIGQGRSEQPAAQQSTP
jgi:hypothetical protein